ncbi:MAG TPA: demethoxyubiquinone hydroxylase family protein [Anaerohalosphaeraceae bacterium]|nr:demethoxyubiquinone hydroxylase family protein [Anaerohalosphaeraceae bacterium]HOL88041.1 demethoxyubiquinone hydroxylase family protein [Anaerohalosphaeraceae bacterium]HPP55289.1 demethoxyubiquinone hydroxylase family protein [Anaerohalosphaeraceae bacterium]
MAEFSDNTNRPSKTPADSRVQTRFLLMPNQANPFGTAFGGAVAAEIDMAASMAAQRHAGGPVVTAAMDTIQFERPIQIGDQVMLDAVVSYAGRTSMEVAVEVYCENPQQGRRALATTAYLTFVAVDPQTGKPRPVPALVPQTPEERKRYDEAFVRVQARQHLRRSQGESRPADERSAGAEVEVLRPLLWRQDVVFRGEQLSPEGRKKIARALRTLHSLELMATTIYRLQIGSEPTELNRELIAAMCNELTHLQDFQTQLYEYGFRPSPLRLFWQGVGVVFGLGSRWAGARWILKTGIWVESKAVEHYSRLLEAAPWEEASRRMLRKNQEDEQGHIRTWQRLLKEMETQKKSRRKDDSDGS